MQSLIKQNSSFIWRWCVFTLVGWALGYLGVYALQSWSGATPLGSFEASLYLLFAIFGAGIGVGLGIGQSFALRPYRVKFIRWTAAALAGWVPSLALGYFVLVLTAVQIDELGAVGYLLLGLTAGGVGGALSGFGQWLTCRSAGVTERWIWVNAVGWSLGAGLGFFLTEYAPVGPTPVPIWIFLVGVPGLVAGIITCLPLLRMVQPPKKQSRRLMQIRDGI